MKKFISFVLAICLVFPLTLALTACGDTTSKEEVGTTLKEEDGTTLKEEDVIGVYYVSNLAFTPAGEDAQTISYTRAEWFEAENKGDGERTSEDLTILAVGEEMEVMYSTYELRAENHQIYEDGATSKAYWAVENGKFTYTPRDEYEVTSSEYKDNKITIGIAIEQGTCVLTLSTWQIADLAGDYQITWIDYSPSQYAMDEHGYDGMTCSLQEWENQISQDPGDERYDFFEDRFHKFNYNANGEVHYYIDDEVDENVYAHWTVKNGKLTQTYTHSAMQDLQVTLEVDASGDLTLSAVEPNTWGYPGTWVYALERVVAEA